MDKRKSTLCKLLTIGFGFLVGCASQPQHSPTAQPTMTGLTLIMGTAAMTMYAIKPK